MQSAICAIASNVRHVNLDELDNPFSSFAQAFREWSVIQDNTEFVLKHLTQWTDESNQSTDPLINYYLQDIRKRCFAIRAASPKSLSWLLFKDRDRDYTRESCTEYQELCSSLILLCHLLAPDIVESLEESL
jgi:hypothetical protein